MKHYITDREAEAITRLLEKVAKMVNVSTTIAALCDIEKREVDLINDVKKRISK